MTRALLGTCLFVVLVATATGDLSACGDKFLRIGRSARTNGYAAVHPASIILLVPKAAKASAVQDFGKQLTKAGHKFQTAASIDVLAAALAKGDVDLIIAASDDVDYVAPHATKAPSKPAILPIVSKENRPASAPLERQYGHVLKLPTDKYDALIEIDHVLRSRPRAASVEAVGQPPQ